jgi:hypothetical protein
VADSCVSRLTLTCVIDVIPMLSMSAVTFTVFAIVAKVAGTGSLGISQAFTSLSLLAMLVVPGTKIAPIDLNLLD